MAFDLEGVEYIDISPVISPDIAVFPGDQKFERNVSYDMEKGDFMTLSSITTTLHLGAHTDAPNHYDSQGEGISLRSLHYYLGPCQVIDVSNKVGRGSMIVTDDLIHKSIETTRILFKTDSFDPCNWNSDFVYFSSKTISYLAENGAILVGIDTPSIDKEDSKNLSSHEIVAKNNMSILEGIDLRDVTEGKYQLVALPLKIKDGDASPVRAVLLPY